MPEGRSVQDLWDEHLRAPFPEEVRDAKVAGIDLFLLDASAAGCVASYLDNPRVRADPELSERAARTLRMLQAALDQAIPTLKGSAKAYFERLRLLSAKVLEDLSPPR